MLAYLSSQHANLQVNSDKPHSDLNGYGFEIMPSHSPVGRQSHFLCRNQQSGFAAERQPSGLVIEE